LTKIVLHVQGVSFAASSFRPAKSLSAGILRVWQGRRSSTTTAGTGSEVTRVLVVTDERENVKSVVFSQFALADAAIVDPIPFFYPRRPAVAAFVIRDPAEEPFFGRLPPR